MQWSSSLSLSLPADMLAVTVKTRHQEQRSGRATVNCFLCLQHCTFPWAAPCQWLSTADKWFMPFLQEAGKLSWATLAPRRSIVLADVFLECAAVRDSFTPSLLPPHSPVNGCRAHIAISSLSLPFSCTSALLLTGVSPHPLQISCIFNPALGSASLSENPK